jgi:hemerythrin superfamily protein
MATMISNGLDVVAFLKEQHQQIKALFSEVRSTRGEQRRDAFFALRRLLAVHETAEEEIVHPAARRTLPNGDVIVDARLQEENKAKQMLSAIEELDLESKEFEAQLNSLAMDVVAHAEAEERQEFGPLGERMDTQQLERMRSAVKLAERVAPTRPHPGVESAAANFMAGPFAAMLDRARDVFSGKASADRTDEV